MKAISDRVKWISAGIGPETIAFAIVWALHPAWTATLGVVLMWVTSVCWRNIALVASLTDQADAFLARLQQLPASHYLVAEDLSRYLQRELISELPDCCVLKDVPSVGQASDSNPNCWFEAIQWPACSVFFLPTVKLSSGVMKFMLLHELGHGSMQSLTSHIFAYAPFFRALVYAVAFGAFTDSIVFGVLTFILFAIVGSFSAVGAFGSEMEADHFAVSQLMRHETLVSVRVTLKAILSVYQRKEDRLSASYPAGLIVRVQREALAKELEAIDKNIVLGVVSVAGRLFVILSLTMLVWLIPLVVIARTPSFIGTILMLLLAVALYLGLRSKVRKFASVTTLVNHWIRKRVCVQDSDPDAYKVLSTAFDPRLLARVGGFDTIIGNFLRASPAWFFKWGKSYRR